MAPNPSPGSAWARAARALLPDGAWTARRSGHGSDEQHRPEGGLLREVVFGANDGFVSNAALVAAVAGGAQDSAVVLLGGIAGLVAGAVSMGLGAYVSAKSEREFRQAEERRERWEVRHMREDELAETRRIFEAKGISGPLLDEVVEAVARNEERWVQVMMADELGFPDQPPRPRRSALVMAASFGAAAFLPVAPYLLLDGLAALAAGLGATAAGLAAVSAWRASLTSAPMLRTSAEMIGLASVAVAVSYGIGRLVGMSIA